MAARVSKKQLILESSRVLGLQNAGLRELRLVQQKLRERLAPAAPPSLGYISKVLGEAGTRVDYEDRFNTPNIPEPYAGRLEAARFDDLAGAEASLERLDAAYREYAAAPDRTGTALVRKLVLHGKQRAESRAANPRVSAEKRETKREIATWCRIWLDSPDLFFNWLEVRKQTEEFQRIARSIIPSWPDETEGAR